MLKLVLQGLAADWLVERSSITEPTPERKTHLTVAKSRAKAKRLSISSMSESGWWGGCGGSPCCVIVS